MIEVEDAAAFGESVDLMRLGRAEVAASPDGISIWGPGLDDAVAAGQITRAAFRDPSSPASRMTVARYRAMFDATPAFCWSVSAGAGKPDAFAAGRAWVRVNLAATARGLGVHPLSQALQEFQAMAGPYTEAAAMFGAGPGGQVQMLARLGHVAPPPPTPRWPAGSRIMRR
jgi:hypothetical protein